MKEHKEHILFAAIIALVIGGIGVQTMRSDASVAASAQTVSLPAQTAAAP